MSEIDHVGQSKPLEPVVVARGDRLTRHTLIVSAFRFINPLLGLIRERVIAHYLGTTHFSDIYRFVVDRVLVDIYTKVEKFLGPTFLPLFVSRQSRDGDEQAFRFFNVMGTLLAVGLIVLSVVGVVWAPAMTGALMPSLSADPTAFSLAVLVLRVSLPFFVFYSLSNLVELTLQSYTNFTLPAAAETLRRLLLVGVLVGAVLLFGRPTQTQAVWALAVGAVTGMVGRFLVQLSGLHGRGHFIRPAFNFRNPDLRRAVVLMLPLIVGVSFALARNLAEVRLASSFGEGNVAALVFARKLVDVPWQTVAIALSVVMYPFISQLGADRDRRALGAALVSTARILTFIFVPFSILIWLLADPIVRVLLETGRFNDGSLRLTLSTFLFYIPGMVVFALEDPLLKWFYALNDTLTPMVLGVFADLIYFCVVFIGINVLGAGLPVLALGLVISKGLKMLIVLVILHLRLGRLNLDTVLPFLGKLAIASLALGIAITTGAHMLAGLSGRGFFSGLLYLFLVSGSGICIFGMVSWMLRIEEITLVLERLTVARRGRRSP